MTRRRLYQILETGAADDVPSRTFDLAILTLILLNAIAVVLESSESIAGTIGGALRGFEVFSMVVFTIEYVLRVWTCVERRIYARPLLGRTRFILSPLALIDLMAILPLYLGPFMAIDLRFMRLFRVFRLIRVFKLSRYSKASTVIGRVLRSKRDELVLAGSIMLTALIMASCVMYYIEHDAGTRGFNSIPETMWWSVATLTTVGYGDVVPLTTGGRIVGAIISILGIGFFALPAGILASGFSTVMGDRGSATPICPHCGRHIDGEGSDDE